MSVQYQGQSMSVYRLAQLTGYPMTSLYRAYHKGLRTGEELLAEATKHLVTYQGKVMTARQLCAATDTSYRRVLRRLKAGVPAEKAVKDNVDRRGTNCASKLSPSEVLRIYELLFTKQVCQHTLAEEYGVHQSTISDIWRHKRWGWLTAPLRYQLEGKASNE
ncbi:hypothetical protein FWP32_22885 [Vibrio alginolyticus]|nr:hypothetical protein [Vibrio alginolyticus]